MGTQRAGQMIGSIAGGLTVLFALWQGIRAWQDRSQLSFVRATFNILMFYLLLTCLWFQQWYAVWPLALAALLPPGHAVNLAFVLGHTTLLAKHLIFGPMFFWIRPLPPKSWRELRFGPAVLGLSWLYALLVIWHTRFRRRNLDDR
jgi:hypothetical protein